MPIPRWAYHSASFCLGAVFATAASELQHYKSRKNSDEERPAVQDHKPSHLQPIKMMPSLPIRIFQPNPHLLIAFDTRTKNPAFVMERLTCTSSTEDLTRADRKNKRFYEESKLAPHHRSRNQHYRNSGYDRGHLAPAADFMSDQEMEDSFCLTNVSPQLAGLNRGMWLRLEEFVRAVAVAENEKHAEIWVITGPLWLPDSVRTSSSGAEDFRYSYIGMGKAPALVSVPTHFFKVVAVLSSKSESATRREQSDESEFDMVLNSFAAFVLPNKESKDKGKRCLANYIVRMTDLEAVSGLEFFPELFGSFGNNRSNPSPADDALPPNKLIADALTDDIRFNSEKSGRITVNNEGERGALIPFSGNEELSKARLRKVNQLLRDNSPIPFQHLCKSNDSCFKMHSI